MLANCTQPTEGAERSVILNEQVTVETSITGTGAVSATYRIQTSGDGTNWDTFRTCSISGTDSATEHMRFLAPTWRIRAVCDSISGTNATLDVYARASEPKTYTVATLRSAAVAGAGARAVVTDLESTTFCHTAVGSGSLTAPVFSDGASWLIG